MKGVKLMKNYHQIKEEVKKHNYTVKVSELSDRQLYHLVETDNWLLVDVDHEDILSNNLPKLMRRLLIEQLQIEL